MSRYLTILLILIFTGFLPLSCIFCGGGSCCGEDFSDIKNFNITDIDISTIDASAEEVDTSKLYSYQRIFKSISITGIEYVAYNTPEKTPSIISGAYACSPPVSAALQKFDEINIIAANSFNLTSELDSIFAGDDITDRFIMTYLWSSDFKPIDEFVNDIYDIYAYDQYRIRLADKPFAETNMRFSISIFMTDSSEYNFPEEVMKVY